MMFSSRSPILKLTLTERLCAKPADLAWRSDTGVLRNVLSCKLLRKMHAFRAMQASELSIWPTGTYKIH